MSVSSSSSASAESDGSGTATVSINTSQDADGRRTSTSVHKEIAGGSASAIATTSSTYTIGGGNQSMEQQEQLYAGYINSLRTTFDTLEEQGVDAVLVAEARKEIEKQHAAFNRSATPQERENVIRSSNMFWEDFSHRMKIATNGTVDVDFQASIAGSATAFAVAATADASHPTTPGATTALPSPHATTESNSKEENGPAQEDTEEELPLDGNEGEDEEMQSLGDDAHEKEAPREQPTIFSSIMNGAAALVRSVQSMVHSLASLLTGRS